METTTGGVLLVVSTGLGADEDVTAGGWLVGEGVLVGEIPVERVTAGAALGTLDVVADGVPRFPVIVVVVVASAVSSLTGM